MNMRTLIIVSALCVALQRTVMGQAVQTPVQGVGTTISIITEQLEFGPVLDVMPYVSSDGYTIQMTIIPTVKEFIGYDTAAAAVFQPVAQSVGASVNSQTLCDAVTFPFPPSLNATTGWPLGPLA